LHEVGILKAQSECLTVAVIADYLQGELGSGQAEELEEHVQECSSCQALLFSEAAKNDFFQAALAAGKYAGELTASAAEFAALKSKLKALSTASACPSPETLPERPLASDGKDLSRKVNVVDFLAPAQSVGELGRLEHYRILEELGRGGMGVVFRAEDTRLERQIAIKVLLPEFARDARARSRFLREAQSAAAVKHENIVIIHHVGQDRDIPYIVMELLGGQSLDQRLRNEPPLTLAESMRIGREVALGLAAAHQRGLIHRDIKPSNIWLVEPAASTTAGRVKILDFGLAKQEEIPLSPGQALTRPGSVLGTPEYMSPEQAHGDAVDFRSDLYAVGVLLYRLTTGQLPFSAKTVSGYAVAHATEIPKNVRQRNPVIPLELADTIMQLLEKAPARRPASAHALADTLERLLEPSTIATQPFPPVAPAGPIWRYQRPGVWVRTGARIVVATARPIWRYRRRVLAATGAVVAALLVAIAIWPYFEFYSSSLTDPLTQQSKHPLSRLKEQPVRVKSLQVMHYARVEGGVEERGVLGDKSFEARFDDPVKISVELTAPAYAYLLAFNADGTEQLLWPVGPDRKPDEAVVPPLQERLEYPARPGKHFFLDDDPGGGLQVFVVVVSSEPLPSYAEWKKVRGAAAWQKLPAGQGVWSSDGHGVYPVIKGQVMRGSEGDLPRRQRDLSKAPPLVELCRSLQQGARGVAVEALAFPVRAKE
jgi:serine/threonine protein kinase